MDSRWRTAGAVAALVSGAMALAIGLLASWASVSLFLGRGPRDDQGWGEFIAWLLAPVALILVVLGGGLLLIGRRVWRERR